MDDKPRLLIVEDDLDLSEMLSSFFQVQDYEVETAAWGADAIRLSRESPFHLVMLDIRLPDIDGYEICRQMRSHFSTKDTPIIFLTEKRDRIDRLQGLELGVVDYITKPFDIQELHLRVRNAINRAAQANISNPVTDLPEGDMIRERLGACLAGEDPWAVLVLSINRLGDFRERYGFVAADEVLRAVALMIRNSVREHGAEEDFIGHQAAESFLVITSPAAVNDIAGRLQARLDQSREYFYPMEDRERIREGTQEDLLQISSVTVTSDSGPFDLVEALLDFMETQAAP